ncbi:ABC transporter ATP-binding protein [Lichenihabitans sp. PAMC28606]|uniref:ABC transporter ATP-binding protein n=1 Tax=Lichenihabitans sp. PAMC28606 TaxID=2880932 RepID=UPI001D0A658C|nr:ABC transporter ATP-binding protein [Lichenihabitans sp. PAMC28606]UDL96057.1 ABC transporter ATP-binding protein [Lichenihabitans sp. PAMC28606]
MTENILKSAKPDILRVDNLKVAFRLQDRPIEVVKGVSFRVPAGKTVALVGESGSGKTVISQAIMGLLPKAGSVTGGQILFSDPKKASEPPVDIALMPRDGSAIRHLRGGRIGMIFQEPMSSLSPVHTIGNQIEEALRLHRPVPHGEARNMTEHMLGLVGFKNPARAYGMYSFELSGGLRQRAMLAMALICRPALLIADEPTTALDVTIQAQVLNLMRELQTEFGMAILMITHDLGVVANMADEVVVVYHGEVMEAGAADDIFRRPGHPYLRALLKAVPHFDMKPNERLVALRDAQEDISPLVSTRPPRPESGNEPLLSVRNLRKVYGSRSSGLFGKPAEPVVAVDDVSFDIMRGECLGLVGESGCGKTSVSKLIMRAMKADGGSVTFNDGTKAIDVLKLRGRAERDFRQHVQMIFQDPVSSLSPRMTVLNILCEPLEIHGMGNHDEQVRRVGDLMSAVGLDRRFLNRYPHSFSGGQRQRIGIARALALNPDLIICDEPVSALDVSVQAQVLNLLKDLQRELGLTYLFISHNLAVVDYVADRIAVLAHGRIVEIAPRDVLFRQPAHSYTKALLAAVPFPDLDRPLDFGSLKGKSASDPARWAPAFRDNGRPETLKPIDLGNGHIVLAQPNVDFRELAQCVA